MQDGGSGAGDGYAGPPLLQASDAFSCGREENCMKNDAAVRQGAAEPSVMTRLEKLSLEDRFFEIYKETVGDEA